ncbi:hypothetical protein ACFYYM_37905 [Streptomyces erythrochromogenes]|uniref:hypothetical protein n=1 Tax=Streptomyces erythrochromogenes TaxID=285574 RepID=UPI00369CC110
MTQHDDTPIAATLYHAEDYRGTAVSVTPDRGGEGDVAVIYSLARLGLLRLGSLRAPPGTEDDSRHPFHQHIGWITHVTVWPSRPQNLLLAPEELGTTWQQYSADTSDLGAWSARVRYVRVWRQRGRAAAVTAYVAPNAPSGPLRFVE